MTADAEMAAAAEGPPLVYIELRKGAPTAGSLGLIGKARALSGSAAAVVAGPGSRRRRHDPGSLRCERRVFQRRPRRSTPNCPRRTWTSSLPPFGPAAIERSSSRIQSWPRTSRRPWPAVSRQGSSGISRTSGAKTGRWSAPNSSSTTPSRSRLAGVVRCAWRSSGSASWSPWRRRSRARSSASSRHSAPLHPGFASSSSGRPLSGMSPSRGRHHRRRRTRVARPERSALLEDLADALGGVVAVSMPMVDRGWYQHSRQVGQTGNRGPRLACTWRAASPANSAIASAWRSPGSIVAINTDATAPIFGICDAGVVGDLHEVVPELIRRIRAAHERGPATHS